MNIANSVKQQYGRWHVFSALRGQVRLAALGLVTAGLVFAGNAPSVARTADSHAHVHHQQHQGAPFAEATVERLADNVSYRITWNAPDAGRVRVFLGSSPQPHASGEPVAVAGNGASGVTVRGLPNPGRTYFTLVPDSGEPLVVADRGLNLSTVPNLRDVGGYRSADGQWVRMGMIFRGDQMDRVSDADLSALSALPVSLVIDLRTASERSREPDLLPQTARPLVLDVAADASGSIGGDMKEAFSLISAGKGVELLTQVNRDFVSLPSARTAYSRMIRELIASDGGVVFHCTAGKDRTGWAAALILTMLGVSRDTVMADYMLSNRYLRAKNDRLLAKFKDAGTPFDPKFLEAVMTVRPEFLQAAFDEVDKRYGSFDAYVRDGLGLTTAEVAAFRHKFLTGGAS